MGRMGAWAHGRMGAWAHGRMGAWAHGCMGAWVHGCMGDGASQVFAGRQEGARGRESGSPEERSLPSTCEHEAEPGVGQLAFCRAGATGQA
jgi:hypothetical protein